MEDLNVNVKDIGDTEKEALEHLLGQQLRENQQLVIRIVSLNLGEQEAEQAAETGGSGSALPDWCAVYEGLSDDEIADLERTVLKRADLTRHFDNP